MVPLTRSKLYFRCLAGAMTDRFAERLSVLLAASVGMLLFGGVSLALVPDQREHERSTQYSELLPGSVDLKASVPAKFAGGMGTIGSAAAFLDHPWIDRLDPGADRDESNDSEDGDDCSGMCGGVVCHAAVGDNGNDICPRRPPSSGAVSTGTPVLLSRSQDPLERPPRVA
jgi:hypothetical protein